LLLIGSTALLSLLVEGHWPLWLGSVVLVGAGLGLYGLSGLIARFDGRGDQTPDFLRSVFAHARLKK
jgi:hypothetical protein